MSIDRQLVAYCAPTLAGIKSGSIFNCSYESCDELRRIIRGWNRALNEKGVYLTILKTWESRAMLYVYRPVMLYRDLRVHRAARYLKNAGYTSLNVADAVETLRRRVVCEESFPHEIGLFLGYPVGDVEEFVKNRGRNCKYCGFWKVYCDEEKTIALFARFKRCINVYMSQWRDGKSVAQLTVAA